ncbi:MAG TPA: CDP-alcohol phosphatidyltransferase family protein [Thermoanaerobaculia bacterium]|nr:CDP-alcohol phosphatidyltransferase family protein [Thermoanaerobaculia bacterium]
MTFTVPNLLTFLRMGLVPLFIIAVVNGDATKALLIFVAAGATDALDGFIARFWGQQSLLGAYLDPIADKLLLTSAYVVLSIPSLAHGAPIPAWVTILVIARDVLILIVVLTLYLAANMRRFPPTVLSKVNTLVQVVAVVLVLAAGSLASQHWLAEIATGAVYLVPVLTVASGLDYIIRASRLEATKAKG